MLIHRKFAGDKKEEQNLWELKKKREMGDEDKFKLPQNLKDQIDDEVENRGLQKLSKAQEDNRLQISNFNDEEGRKLEERLRREGKLSENEIENILNDYDMHTRDMAIMLQEDEHRQQENFKRQLEARKKRRQTIFDEIEQLKEERKKQKAKDAQDMKEEQDSMSRQLIDEEKELRKNMEKDLEDKKNASLAEFKNKLKKNKDKDNFKELLEEYSRKEKEVEKDLYNERNRALANIQAKLNERKRALARKLEIEKEDPLAEKIESKISLLKKEAEDEAAEILEEERRKKKIQAQLSLMRKENDEFISHLRDVNQEKYEDFCKELDQKYDENKLGKLIDVKSGSESLQSMREELADLFSLVKRTKNPEEIAKYQQRIEELKKLIANSDKDGKLEENIKKNNKLLQERAKLIEERESKKKEFKWKQFEDEEKERDALLEKERQEWLKKEKEAIDAVVNKFFDKEDPEGLAEVLDQVYGAGSKLYSDRLFDQNNKLQEKKARRLKYNFNSNLDNKIHDIEELSKGMNPQLERLNAKKYLIPEDDYKSQLKDLMMKENEKRAEIEAMAASREQDSQSKTMLNFVDLQKNMIDHLNEDMKELREYAFKPDKFKDKQLKNEVKKLNQKYDKELEKMKKDEEESKKKQIDDINNRFKKGRDELEKNRRDFEMLGLFEKRLDDNKTNEEKFRMQNKKLMLDQLSKEKDKLGKELTDDEKAILMENYERKMKNLNKALEREFNRQNKDHSKQLADKIRELEMKKRERELLLNSLSMYKDARAEQIAYEDNFEKLASIIEEDLELIDHEAYSYKPMKIYDLIKWKRETDDFLDALGGDATLLERVRRIEKYVGNLDTSSYNRIKKLIEKIKKRG